MRLTALLRGVLRSEGEFTTLGRELDIVESYLDIERARFEHRLRVTIDVPASAAEYPASAASAPAVGGKRGQAWHRAHSKAVATSPFARESNASTTSATSARRSRSKIRVPVPRARALQRGRSAGLGLRNVERRLECQYGTSASLSIRTAPGEGTTVEIRLPAAVSGRG